MNGDSVQSNFELLNELNRCRERSAEIERQLADALMKQRRFFESITDAFVEVDINGLIIDSNKIFQDMLGYSADELKGMSVRDITPPKWRAAQEIILRDQVLKLGCSDVFQKEYIRKDGTLFPIELRIFLIRDAVGEPSMMWAFIRDISERKRIEEALNLKILALTNPLAEESKDLKFEELLDLNDVQKIQDSFSEATGVASVITTPEGVPITRPSGFCRLCANVIRGTEKGRENCYYSDSVLGRKSEHGPVVQPCLSGGLFDGGTSICIGDKHIANWLVGQVLDSSADEKRLLSYANKIGADETEFAEALKEVTRMSREQFEKVCQAVHVFAQQLSMLAFKNFQQAKYIHERKQAEQSLQAERDFQTALLQTVGALVIVCDKEGRIVKFNRACEELAGYSFDEVSGREVWSVLSELEEREGVQDILNKIYNGEEISPFEGHWRSRNGDVCQIVWRHTSLRDVKGEISYIIGAGIDITNVRRSEEEHRRLQAQVQQAQKLESLGVLAGGIAHDFNNFLMVILGNSDLALRELPEFSTVRSMLCEIDRTARRAAELCKQMLAYSGKGRFIVRPINLSEVISDMGDMLRVPVSRKAEFNLNLADNLPLISADITQIRQVVMNLVTNASEAIGGNSGTITLTTGVMECDSEFLQSPQFLEDLPEGQYVFLDVKDTGCGMGPSTIERVFDPFFSTKFTGRGLGLAAVQGIIRGHHGTMKVQSEQGKGSLFRVLLPVLIEQPEPEEQAQPECNNKWRGSGSILLVDDEETILKLGKRMLERLGFLVITASDGNEALTRFRENVESIRLILLDLSMPCMDGEETLYAIREISSSVRVLMTSGYNEQDVLNRLRKIEFTGFIQKPYRLESLTNAVREALGE